MAALALLGGAIAAQLVPVERSNPPSRGAVSVSVRIDATLRRACYDCHSNETRWPWYSHIAPFSWLIVHDVTLGRKEVNFSEWATYYSTTRRRKLEWIGRALREGKMPPRSYEVMHPGARLTAADRRELELWIEAAIATRSGGKATE
jgi:Haem-binding domain